MAIAQHQQINASEKMRRRMEERFPLRKRPRRPPWNPEFCFFGIVSVYRFVPRDTDFANVQ
ncbi:MAG: hypothetical protein ACD_39C01100G0001, partial [uncultured bacterium]